MNGKKLVRWPVVVGTVLGVIVLASFIYVYQYYSQPWVPP